MRLLKKCPAYSFKYTNKITGFGISSPNWNPPNLMNYAVNNVYRDDKLLLGMRFSLPAVLQQLGIAILGSLHEPKCGDRSHPQSMLQYHQTRYRRFSNCAGNGQPLSRDWLAQLWTEDKRKIKVKRGRRKRQPDPRVQDRSTLFDRLASQLPFLNSVIRKPAQAEQDSVITNETIWQPPISHYDGEHLSPSSPEEVKLTSLLSRANLVITRDIEWANIMFAFEQESRYVILDPCYPKSPVGFIQEKSNVIFRQLLRGRRPFIAYIFDGMGNEIFRVRRPFWWINSTIYVEVDGKEVGVVHSRWHLWRRIYDLYLGNKQFAVVENPGLWNWTFTLKDEDESVLAQIDRDWRGIGFELFTDAGQYVIRFGDAGSHPKTAADSRIEELEVARPLSLSERAVAVALAVSLDSDYFSRNRGWGLPLLVAGE